MINRKTNILASVLLAAALGITLQLALVFISPSVYAQEDSCQSVGVLSPEAAAECPLGSPANPGEEAQPPGSCPSGTIELGTTIDGQRCIPESDDIADNVIIVYLRYILRFLATGVGLVIVVMIVIAGIQYVTARDNPQSTAAAKNRIWNAIVALLLFIFAFAILNYLVPGGLIG